MVETFIIVGAAHTGGMAAETLRQEGFDGQIILIGAEKHRPYIRPPLSKNYLRGEEKLGTVYLQANAAFYKEHKIELRLNSQVTKLNTSQKNITLDDGKKLGYDKLLLATGAVVNKLKLPGSQLKGVHYLRTIEDSDAIRKAARKGAKAVIIGSSWIGMEVAACLRQLGAEVTVISRTALPLESILGQKLGQVYLGLHQQHGVNFLPEKEVARVRGNSSVSGVELTDGTVIDSDLVVVGIGISPNTKLAESAGLKVDNGIVTDEYLQTSASNIYAAGDVANAYHPFYKRHVRFEHWANAQNQGKAVAKNMLGKHQPYERLPYFYSDQFDTYMEYSGFNKPDDEVVFRGDLPKRQFVTFWLRDGKITAGLLMNYDKLKIETIQEAIRSQRHFEVAQLQNEKFALSE